MTERAQIAVIGSGPGGAVAACTLAEAGRDVLLCVKGVEAMVDREGDLATALADILAEPETKSGLGRKSSGAASFAKLL